MAQAQILPLNSARKPTGKAPEPRRLAVLRALERKILWLSSWMIHHANQVRPRRDGLKVGGHQASSASSATLLTALYLHALRPEDRVAVKPHASPVFHAIQYLLGRQSVENLQRFRALGGAQSYPSRTKDVDDVDFSTGSVGLGVAATLFASIVQDYVQLKKLAPAEAKRGRMVAIVGDAEFDEGNVFEAMLEGWKHDVRDLWWVIDYNRQSLDSVVSDQLFQTIERAFEGTGWRVVTLKYGKLLEDAFRQPGGAALRRWIDECPNAIYSALCYKGGAAWREHMRAEIGQEPGVAELLARYNDDDALHRLMTNLAGHDLESIIEAFDAASADDTPTCFIAYTIKGFGLPFAGHKDNHAGIMSDAQVVALRDAMGIKPGEEWEKFAGMDLPAPEIEQFLKQVPFAGRFPRRYTPPAVTVPGDFPVPAATKAMSTQEGFGKILYDLAGGTSELASRIVTTSPDVTVSTNLGGWVNRRGLFDRRDRSDVFKAEKVVSAQTWAMNPSGQHVELGIAENNLFLMLAAAGLSAPLFGARLLPVGTLYDPFIERGLDALNYACYQDARFMLAATPAGVTLAPEGGAHQSIATPLIGIGQPGLSYFEPAYVDELAAVMEWGFGHMQAEEGGSVYMRLSTRPLPQPERAPLDAKRKAEIVAGGYWVKPPAPGCDLAVAYVGALAPEATDAYRQILEDVPGAGLLAITSPDRLHAGWQGDPHGSHVAGLLGALPMGAGLVTVIDGHPATMSWLGAVRGQRIRALGVDRFGQSGDIPDLYKEYGLDAGAILDAAAALCLGR